MNELLISLFNKFETITKKNVKKIMKMVIIKMNELDIILYWQIVIVFKIENQILQSKLLGFFRSCSMYCK